MVGRNRVPIGFGTMPVSDEQREMLERLSLSIFADMSNSGHAFQAALAAVYFSGMQHALESSGLPVNEVR